MENINCDECNFSNQYCYDCKYRYCHHENCKYQKLINRTECKLNDDLFWIDIDWEENDKVSNLAFERYLTWLTNHGFGFKHPPSFKRYMLYRSDGMPVTDCGYHTGTLYFYKIRKGDD